MAAPHPRLPRTTIATRSATGLIAPRTRTFGGRHRAPGRIVPRRRARPSVGRFVPRSALVVLGVSVGSSGSVVQTSGRRERDRRVLSAQGERPSGDVLLLREALSARVFACRFLERRSFGEASSSWGRESARPLEPLGIPRTREPIHQRSVWRREARHPFGLGRVRLAGHFGYEAGRLYGRDIASLAARTLAARALATATQWPDRTPPHASWSHSLTPPHFCVLLWSIFCAGFSFCLNILGVRHYLGIRFESALALLVHLLCLDSGLCSAGACGWSRRQDPQHDGQHAQRVLPRTVG